MIQAQNTFDVIIVGCGILGGMTAIQLHQKGLKVLVIDKNKVGLGASGVNAGTLSLQIKRVHLMPYALKGRELWESYGSKVGYVKTGGYTLAFNDYEAELLQERMTLKKEAGAPIEFHSTKTVLKNVPSLSSKIKLASFCPLDGYANSSLTGNFLLKSLKDHKIPIMENCEISDIIQSSEDTYQIQTSHGTYKTTKLLLASGTHTNDLLKFLNLELPINTRINMVSVTEKTKKILPVVIGHASGLLTLKQKQNGTILIGGGWQGYIDDKGKGKIDPENLSTNLSLASYAVPFINQLKLIRTWTGLEGNTPDFYPLAGKIPITKNAYVLCCVRGGYTIGPYIAKVMADIMTDNTEETPLFSPARFH